MRSGSCEVTIVSMWYLAARKRRMSKLDALVAVTSGNTAATALSAGLLMYSASTRKALPLLDKCTGILAKIAFSRALILRSVPVSNWSWRRLSRVKGGFIITMSDGSGCAISPLASTCSMPVGQASNVICPSGPSSSKEPSLTLPSASGPSVARPIFILRKRVLGDSRPRVVAAMCVAVRLTS